ncbi:MAG: BatA domain-containing protein, partial [Myxococcota bacterium]
MDRLAFVHPGFLWFLLLAALPPIIHLLGRRRPRRVVYPPFRFVLKVERETRSRRRIHSILLLILRTLLILLIPLALARPQLARPASGQGGYALDVVILDNSMSTMQRVKGQTAFYALEKRALEIASQTSPSRRLLLVTASRPPVVATPEPVQSAAEAGDAIRSVKPSHRSTAIGAAVAAARAAVDAASPASARGYLLGDLAKHGYADGEDLSITVGGARIPFEIFDAAPDPGQNLAPVSVAIRQGGAAAKFEVGVANHGYASARTGVELRLEDGGKSSGQLDVPGRSAGLLAMELPADLRRGVYGSVQIQPDALVEDNTLFFARPPGGVVSVLIVDGDPRASKYADEAFYLEKALTAGGDAEFEVTVTTPEAIPELAGRYDVMAILNSPAIPAGGYTAIEEFVAGGGGVLIAAGERLDAGGWNSAAWIPARFGASPVTTIQQGMTVTGASHPALAPLSMPGGASLGVKLQRRLELAPMPGSTVLLASAEGRPLLVAGVHGGGRTAVFGSTLDRGWSDWPIRTSYLPVMRSLLRHLARGGSAAVAVQASPGEVKKL